MAVAGRDSACSMAGVVRGRTTACSRTLHELMEMLVSYPALRRTASDVKSEMGDTMKAVNG
jgi:hypothetical protein